MEQNPVFDPKKWIDWVQEHENEPVPDLALRYAARKDLPLKELLNQVKGRQTARNKLPTFYAHPEILYPDTMILEQCSSEEAAAHKAVWATGKVVVDLTGGLGIDTLAFARTATKVFYCEPDAARCAAARYNFNLLEIQNVEVIQGTAGETSARLPEQADIFFLDPSRRSDSGKKVFRIEDLSPNLLELKDQLLTDDALLMVKLAPMLDIREGLRLIPETIRVEVISRKDECRELLFFLAKKSSAPDIICIDTGNLNHAFNFQPKEEATLPLPIGEPEEYLFEPNASIRKAGPWRSICKTYGIKMLHPNSHLFTSPTPLVDFPGRMFRIEQVLPYKKEKIKSALEGNPAQLVFYNFPVNAADVTKSLGIKSGEPKYLFFTSTESQRTIVLLAERISGE